MLERLRALMNRLMTPIARALLRIGLTPDAVTVLGTAGVATAALGFFPQGMFATGALVATAFVFSDAVDGQMARVRGHESTWGGFLDSSMDRLGDAALFGGLVLWYAGDGGSVAWAALALYCLVMGNLTSYVRAKAESLGLEAKVGIAGRPDRLLLILLAAFIAGVIDRNEPLVVALALLAVGSTVTVAQRVVAVRRQVTTR